MKNDYQSLTHTEPNGGVTFEFVVIWAHLILIVIKFKLFL